MIKSFYLLAPLCLLLASCGGASKPLDAGASSVQRISLSNAQQKLVNNGVREMLAKVTSKEGNGTRLVGMAAFRLKSAGSIHVCGDVSYHGESQKATLRVPYYLEFEDQNGVPEAKRGQVGFDKLKKSKVTFMCRHVSDL